MTSVPYEYGDLLAPIERVAARVPEGIATADDIALAQEMLAEASDAVRAHGRNWTSVDVPPGVVTIVAAAAARGYMNPAGYAEEDADSAGLKRAGMYSRGAALTAEEVRRVKALASRSGFVPVPASKPSSWKPTSLAYDRERDPTTYVPWGGASKAWFPFEEDPFGPTWQPGRVW